MAGDFFASQQFSKKIKIHDDLFFFVGFDRLLLTFLKICTPGQNSFRRAWNTLSVEFIKRLRLYSKYIHSSTVYLSSLITLCLFSFPS